MPGTMPPDYVPQTHHLDRRAADIAATIADADGDLFRTRTAAEFLGTSERWLINGRHKGYGPPFTKLSPRQVRYRREDLRAWLRERTYRCTADDPANGGRRRSPGGAAAGAAESATAA
jgi:hypothetical protein